MTFFKHLRIAGTLLALGAGMLAAGQASAQSVNDIVKRGKVRIGVLIGAPPYGSVDSTGNAIGYDADVAALVGKYIGLHDAYKSLAEALAHGGIANHVRVRIDWIDSEKITDDAKAAELLAKALQGTQPKLLHGAAGAAHFGGDLVPGAALLVPQRHHHALLRRQLLNRLL